jgi:hypothetical protein
MAVEGAGDEIGEMNIGKLFLSVNLVDVKVLQIHSIQALQYVIRACHHMGGVPQIVR